MIDYKPELVIAFPGGAGTENMVKISLQNKITVQRVEDTTPPEVETRKFGSLTLNGSEIKLEDKQ